MTWNTADVLAVFLDCDIWVHHQYFFGNIHCFPVISPMGTSQSHELEHCECTVHVPAGVITGKLSGNFKMYLQCSRWVHCWYTVHFLVMYLQCSWWDHHYLPLVIGGYARSSSPSGSSSGDDAWVSDSSRRRDDLNPEVGSSSGTAVPNSEGAPNAAGGQHPDRAELPPPRHAYASWLAGRRYAERSSSGVGSARSSICAGG